MNKMKQLRSRVSALPNPYHLRAMGHILDAECDLARWPFWEDKILEDCERSIEYWETAAVEGVPVLDD